MLFIALSPNLGVPTMAFLKMQLMLNLGYAAMFSWIVFGTEGVGVNWYMMYYIPIFAIIVILSAYFLSKSGQLKAFMV